MSSGGGTRSRNAHLCPRGEGRVNGCIMPACWPRRFRGTGTGVLGKEEKV